MKHAPRPLALRLVTLSLGLALLGACSSPPPAPDWQAQAFDALATFSSTYLQGNTRLADQALARARLELSRTGRADLLARAELTHCAVRVASLVFDGCASYQSLAPDAGPQAQAYAAYLNGQWQGLRPEQLPEQHRAVLTRTPGAVLADMDDPLARLVAAGVLLQQQRLMPADVDLAVETASGQGWRRALLAWLGVQRQLALAAGEPERAARVQRRMALTSQTIPLP